MTQPNPRRFSVVVVNGAVPTYWTCDEVKVQGDELLLINSQDQNDPSGQVFDQTSFSMPVVAAIEITVADR